MSPTLPGTPTVSCGPPVRTLSFPISVAFSKGGSAPNQGVSDIFVLTDADFKRGIRVGVKVRQTTGTAVEMVRGTVILDLELRS